eukprot:TRINITY_DN1462_c9_g1_i1.p2 TRINITY_DN1462_c9_g1~~TRINITY_DN1462_c9_g1_i1.p2  ORF type:complete len:126 (-),score=14.55 TRINITY_DN1462_c9_g1_i1:500-877(-)
MPLQHFSQATRCLQGMSTVSAAVKHVTHTPPCGLDKTPTPPPSSDSGDFGSVGRGTPHNLQPFLTRTLSVFWKVQAGQTHFETTLVSWVGNPSPNEAATAAPGGKVVAAPHGELSPVVMVSVQLG